MHPNCFSNSSTSKKTTIGKFSTSLYVGRRTEYVHADSAFLVAGADGSVTGRASAVAGSVDVGSVDIVEKLNVQIAV